MCVRHVVRRASLLVRCALADLSFGTPATTRLPFFFVKSIHNRYPRLKLLDAGILVLACSISFSNAIASETSTNSTPEQYALVMQESPRFSGASDRSRSRDSIMSDVLDGTAPESTRLDAIIEVGVHIPCESVPWKELIAVAESPEASDAIALWSVISAGKSLCQDHYPLDLEQWLFKQIRHAPNSRRGHGAIIVLHVSGIAENSVLRESSKLLRDPATSDDTCACIGKYLAYGSVFGRPHVDARLNCLLAACDDAGIKPERRRIVWRWVEASVETQQVLRQYAESSTLRTVHELALQEFANQESSEELRGAGARCLREDGAISIDALEQAKRLLRRGGPEKLLDFAERVVRMAGEQGGD